MKTNQIIFRCMRNLTFESKMLAFNQQFSILECSHAAKITALYNVHILCNWKIFPKLPGIN